ncbi:MAG: arylsulfatase [Verrucomicrobiota bacterium]
MASDDAPNFVFILADDMGYGDVSHAGGKIPTPHLDQMAARGMRFTDAHTSSSVCTPTRYGLLTGRYNWRTKLKSGVLWPPAEPLIAPDRMTVAGFLKDRGYATCVVGKWHLGLDWARLPDGKKATAKTGPTKGPCWDIDFTKPVEGGPLSRGFTHDFLFPASLDMPPYVYLKNDVPVGIPTVTKAFKQPNRPGPATEDFEASDCLIDFARESRAFIGNMAKEKKPFFLYLPLTSPHTPIVPSSRWAGKSPLGPYGDFVMETDWVVGEVLAELAERGVTENTVLIFSTDNGCSPMAKFDELKKKGHYPNAPWRGHKADIFEGGHRVPFLVQWPARVEAGTTCDRTICLTDFFATAADVLGAVKDVPPNAAEDSFSFLPALKDPGSSEAQRPSIVHHSINGSFALRKGPWKLNLCAGSGGWSNPRPKEAWENPDLAPVQLYHLEKDGKEEHNLEKDEKERIQSMVQELVSLIRKGRSTPGPDQTNEGWPNTFHEKVLARFPELGGQ